MSERPTLYARTALLGVDLQQTDVRDTYRPSLSRTGQLATYYVETTGSDDNDGSQPDPGVGNVGPLATLARAIQLVGELNSDTATIQMGIGVFPVGRVLTTMNNLTVQGTLTVRETAIIVAGSVVTGSGFIRLDLTGLAVAADALEGDLLEFTNGAATGLRGRCFRNLATNAINPGETRVYVTQDPAGAIVPPLNDGSGAIDFLDRDTTLSMEAGGASNWMTSTQFNLRGLRIVSIEGTRALNILVTDKIEFRDCDFESMNRPNVGGYGRAFFIDCYIAVAGSAPDGMLSVTNGAFALVQRGTVVDSELNATPAGRRFVSANGGALLAFQGQVVVRRVDEFRIDGVGGFIAGGASADDTLYFDDADGAAPTCAKAFVINSTGEGFSGFYQLPNLFGTIVDAFAIEAQGCACVVLGTGTSSLATSSGVGTVNAVSADGGVSASSFSRDGTTILNGAPSLAGFFSRFRFPSPAPVVAGPYTAVIFERVTYDPTGGIFTILAPAVPAPVAGDRFGVHNVTTDLTAITVSGNGNPVEDIGAPGTFPASFNLSAAGARGEWEWDGLRWLLVA